MHRKTLACLGSSGRHLRALARRRRVVRAIDDRDGNWAAQISLLSRMGGPARTALAFRLTGLAREATRAGIRARHPEYDEDAVRRAFFRLLHGDAVTRKVWPDRELLEP